MKPCQEDQKSLCVELVQQNSAAYGGFRFVIGVPPVIIHFERWDFPRTQPSSVVGGTPMTMETPISQELEHLNHVIFISQEFLERLKPLEIL